MSVRLGWKTLLELVFHFGCAGLSLAMSDLILLHVMVDGQIH